MGWKEVGDWLKDNAGTGASLVGSLLTGNVGGAVAAGVALVSSATGTNDPVKALEQLQNNPEALIKLKELTVKDEENIRAHIRSMAEMEYKDNQAEHHETQETIRSGDNAEDIVVRRTRPLQSWLSLVASIVYVYINMYMNKEVDIYVLVLLLTLPWAYAGLREVGKGITTIAASRAALKVK
jgi:hypothetical protein